MKKRILIIGAGEAGRMVVREIAAHPESGLEPVGFLDDDATLAGANVEGLPVFGVSGDLPGILGSHPVDEVLIAVPSADREFVRRMVGLCRDAQVAFKIVPGLIEIIKGPVHLEQIREVHPDDLLGRETVEFDEPAIQRELSGKRVLITGAGGSIGGEIARQVCRFDPAELFLLGRGENQIFAIEHELKYRFPSLAIEPLIADIRNRDRLTAVFADVRPQYVFHAAAHKHVHYMEAFPEEAVLNNIFGTANVIDASDAAGAERLVMMSTDKAVRPHGVMGATKRLAERLVQLSSQSNGGMRAISVRFGNVLGSRGSVVPLFIEQIRARRPVTVSHPDATRFFMTLREACMLVIQASIMGRGGEIFILRMGTPIRIMEIVKDLAALHGLRMDDDVTVSFIGLRPGEKLNEDLVADSEQVEQSPHEHIFISRPDEASREDLDAIMGELKRLAENGDGSGIRRVLDEAIPDARLT